MKSVIFIISAYFTGVIAAVPAGPVQVEVVRRSVNGHLRSSLMVVLGAMIADIAYGIIAFFEIAPVLQENHTRAVFSLIGAVVLIFLGALVLRQSLTGHSSKPESRYLRKKRWGLISGLSLSAANPMMILWWLIGAKIFIDIELIDKVTPDIAVSFLAAGGLGLATYLILLSIILYRIKRFMSETNIQRVNLISGIVLLSISLYFIYTSLKYFLG